MPLPSLMFIDLDRTDKPVVFVTPGRGKDTVAKFKAFLATHGGSPGRIVEVVDVCVSSRSVVAGLPYAGFERVIMETKETGLNGLRLANPAQLFLDAPSDSGEQVGCLKFSQGGGS